MEVSDIVAARTTYIEEEGVGADVFRLVPSVGLPHGNLGAGKIGAQVPIALRSVAREQDKLNNPLIHNVGMCDHSDHSYLALSVGYAINPRPIHPPHSDPGNHERVQKRSTHMQSEVEATRPSSGADGVWPQPGA